MKIVLLGKPISTQNAYGQVRNRRYMKKKARETKASYIQQVGDQYKGEVLECNLAMEILLYFGDKRRRDRDNRHKISMDSLEGIVYKDDTQIQQAKVSKFIDKENPRIEIFISKFTDE